MSLEIIKPGLLTTIQDTGRYYFRKQGIVVSGAMDTFSLRIANLLVGNAQEEAALEITFSGPEIRFTQAQLIAITGTLQTPCIDKKPVSLWKPVYVRAGSLLTFDSPRRGCRAYLAVAGGLDVPKIMGSYATYLQAKVGGWQGRSLQTGDIIRYKHPAGYRQITIEVLEKSSERFKPAKWGLASAYQLEVQQEPMIRVVKGPEYEHLTEESRRALWNELFHVSTRSDRMGYRLEGMSLLLKQPVELISSAVSFGTIQLPPKGNPIILMADHQTTGGYPRIAQVISADLPVLAHISPQQKIRFKEVSLEEAQELYYQRESIIGQLREAVKYKFT
jgi:antagonist of KipI